MSKLTVGYIYCPVCKGHPKEGRMCPECFQIGGQPMSPAEWEYAMIVTSLPKPIYPWTKTRKRKVRRGKDVSALIQLLEDLGVSMDFFTQETNPHVIKDKNIMSYSYHWMVLLVLQGGEVCYPVDISTRSQKPPTLVQTLMAVHRNTNSGRYFPAIAFDNQDDPEVLAIMDALWVMAGDVAACMGV